MSAEVWTAITDLLVSAGLGAVAIWIAPEYREFFVGIIAGLQGVAVALIVEFRGQRREAALRAQINSLMGRR